MHLALLTGEWEAGGSAGGIGTYSRTLAAEAVRLGHAVTVLAADGRRTVDEPSELVERAGVRIWSLPTNGLRARDVAETLGDRWQWLLRTSDVPDVAEAPEFGGVAALAACHRAVPVATRLHTPLALILERGVQRAIYPDDDDRCELERAQVSASSLVTSPSAWLAREAARLWELRSVPRVIPNPLVVDVEELRSPSRAEGLPRLLYFGRLEHRKGVLVLGESFRRLLDTRGPVAELVFVGADTRWEGRSMKARICDELGSTGLAYARFIEPLDASALGELLDEVDLVVLPSLYENFSYACLEAMRHSRPVLATRGSGFDEIIDDRRTGFLVAPGSVDALAKALQHVEDLRLLRQVGVRAREAVMSFDSRRIVPLLLDAYHDLAKTGAGTASMVG